MQVLNSPAAVILVDSGHSCHWENRKARFDYAGKTSERGEISQKTCRTFSEYLMLSGVKAKVSIKCNVNGLRWLYTVSFPITFCKYKLFGDLNIYILIQIIV